MNGRLKHAKRWAPILLIVAAGACGGTAAGPTGSAALPAPDGNGSAASSRPALLGQWQLVSLSLAGEAPVAVEGPERFTVDFGVDERVALRADCNRCIGGYEASGGALRVGAMACTKAYCSSAPLDTNFAALVSGATGWQVNDAGLELHGPSGTALLRR
jgi:heat shock protein HslJ